MFKFLRKYNKWILAIGGTLLMITFIAPQLIQQFGGGNPGQQIVGTYDGGRIDAMQLQRANAELQIAGTLAPTVISNLGVRGGVHWYLLGTLAERNGFLASVEDGRDFLNLIATGTAQRQAGFGLDQEELRELILAGLDEQRILLITERGYTPQQIDLALARLRSIDRLVASISGQPMGGGIALSGPELQLIGRRLFEQARVNIATFDANSGLASDLPTADETQLQEVFERFQSEKREENEFGIGYYREPAVAVEWVIINRNTIAAALQLDPIEVRKYHINNPEQFPGVFENERTRVEAAYRAQEVNRIVEAGVRAIRSELLRATRVLPADGRFRVLPDDWRRTRPSTQDLAAAATAAINQEPGLSGTMPVETGRTAELVEPARLNTLPTISNAFTTMGARRVSFAELVLNVRELNPDTTLSLQRGLAFGPISDAPGNRSFFRVVEVRQAGPAPILDVVRDRVVADARQLIAYEDLSSESGMASIRSVLETEGVSGLAGTASRTFNDVSVTRSALVSGAGTAQLASVDREVFREAILEYIKPWDATTIAADLPLEQRTLIVPIPGTLTVAAVEITRHFPATRERVRQADATVSFAARDELQRDITRPVLSFESIVEMMNFSEARPTQPEDEEFLDEEESPS